MELSNTSVRWINTDSGAKLDGSSGTIPSNNTKFKQQFSGQFELMRDRQGNAGSGKNLPPIQAELRPSRIDEEIQSSSKSLLHEISAFNDETSDAARVKLQNFQPDGALNSAPELTAGSAETTTFTSDAAAPEQRSILSSEPSNTADYQGAAQVKQQNDSTLSEQSGDALPKMNVATDIIANAVTKMSLNKSTASTETQPRQDVPTNLASAFALQHGLAKADRLKKTDTTLQISTEKLYAETSQKVNQAVKVVMVESSATLTHWLQLKQAAKTENRTLQDELSALGGATERAPQTPTLDTLSQARPAARLEQDAHALSQRFAEQLGQRLVQQVQKGHWRAELELHPKSLGRIDVQLDFIDGRLDGQFQAHNQLTRDLLQDSLPRLREWLQQSGTQVANLDVNSGNAGQGGGKPTPQPLTSEQGSGSVRVVAETEEAETQRLSPPKEGFDLLV